VVDANEWEEDHLPSYHWSHSRILSLDVMMEEGCGLESLKNPFPRCYDGGGMWTREDNVKHEKNPEYMNPPGVQR
jgi:hypothetical protein